MGLFQPASEGKAFFDAGRYIATLVDVKFKPKEESLNPDFGDQLQWFFEMTTEDEPDGVIVQDDGETPSQLFQFSSTLMTPKAKARQWVEAFLGRKLNVGEEVGLKDIQGKRAIVVLVDKPSKDGTKVFSNIVSAEPYDPAVERKKPSVRTRAPADRGEVPF